jgi:hypothetical protein
MRRDMMLWLGVGVIIGVTLSAAVFLSKPMPALAQSATTPLPAPSCSVGNGTFACAADLTGGGRQEVVVGTAPAAPGTAYRGVIISGTGTITPLTY